MTLLAFILLLAPQAEARDFEASISPAVAAAVAARNDVSPEALVEQLSALADGGDMSANELLGEAYQFGKFGLTSDVGKACDYFARAAQERPDSAHNLATCFYDGRGLPRDLAKARALYLKASDRGFPKAHCALGNMLLAGEGGPQDVATGLRLCRKSAELGVADAQTDLGGYLLVGKYVGKDVVAARGWLQKAAEQKTGQCGISARADLLERRRRRQRSRTRGAMVADLPCGRTTRRRLLGDAVDSRQYAWRQRRQAGARPRICSGGVEMVTHCSPARP